MKGEILPRSLNYSFKTTYLHKQSVFFSYLKEIDYQITFTHCERTESRSKWCPCLCCFSHRDKFPSPASRTAHLVKAHSFRIHEKPGVGYTISKQLFLFITPSICTYTVTMSMCYKAYFHDWMKTSSGSNMKTFL